MNKHYSLKEGKQMPELSRCGTGFSGCTGNNPPSYPSFDNMCNGVFAPVCAPEICNVPRIPHYQILVTGEGIVLDTDSGQNISFNLLIERFMQVYKGQLFLQAPSFNIIIPSQNLKFFETDGHLHMSVLFYEESTQRNILVTLHQSHMSMPTQLFIYSVSNMDSLIHIQGNLVSGTTNLYADSNVHAH